MSWERPFDQPIPLPSGPPRPAPLQHLINEAARLDPNRMVRLSVPPGASSTWIFSGGRTINVPDSRIVEVTQKEAKSMYPHGCQPID
jgi:hypothetical protein